MILSNEQEKVIELVKAGKNVLVDACIGSGKTRTIQEICDRFPEKTILYLTYNKLLKEDAKQKIKNKNVWVTNYHGYAYCILVKHGVKCGMSDLIQIFNRLRPEDLKHYDLLLIDEYQDIEQELSELLEIIKERNPGIQIVAVGDMCQKIYDKTTLFVEKFIKNYLGPHEEVQFTQCFRICEEHASMLGDIWKKEIKGVNNNCIIKEMFKNEIVEYLSTKEPKDILCLGRIKGDSTDILNDLEFLYPKKFNKHTVYATIREGDSNGYNTPKANSAIFTTYDGCKGMERPICVIFDWDQSYWWVRSNQKGQKYEILRNIFCVAASRGKDEIIFVKSDNNPALTSNILKRNFTTNTNYKSAVFGVSEMFDFKYKEDIEDCYKMLNITTIQAPQYSITLKDKDANIDLSPVLGYYQQVKFFKNFNIDKSIDFWNQIHSHTKLDKKQNEESIEQTILRFVATNTKQKRYETQVDIPFIKPEETKLICDRLNEVFDGDEEVQQTYKIYAKTKTGKCTILGEIDVWKDNMVYELKFTNSLSHTAFLQLAMYLILTDTERGILFNTKLNEIYGVEISNKQEFLDKVMKCITKGEETHFEQVNF